ncbi:hypothetical protein AB7M17_001842 [Bradyrhizobium sp. USDA 377]
MQRPSARRGKRARPSAARTAACSAAALRRPSRGRPSELQRRQAPRAGAGGCRPGAAQPEFRQRARRQEAFHPAGQASASPSGLEPRRELGAPPPDVRPVASRFHRVPESPWELESRREPGPLPPDVRAASSERHRGPALPLEQAQHRVPAIPPEEASRDVRRAAVRRGGRPAARRACCPEPALRSAQVLSSERVSPSEREWLPAQARRGGPQAARGKQEPWALVSPRARAAPQELRQAVAEKPAGPQEAESSARAAEPPREAAPAAWEPDVLQAAEAAVSGRAAAGPRPEAAKAAWEQQAAGVAAAEPDGLREAAEVEVVLPVAAARRPAEAQQAGGAVQLRVAVRPGARARQAAWPQAGPLAAASVFRQGPSLAAGPARPRAAKRFAHAMRCWPIASR